MKFGKVAVSIVITVFALSGCMGGGAGGGGGTGVDASTIPEGGGDAGTGTPNSEPAEPGTNGLDYGSNGQSLTQVEGRTVTMRAAGFGGADGLGVSNVAITLAAGFFDERATTQDRDGSIEIFSETVTITNGAGNLANGDEVRIAFEPDRAGQFAAIVDATVSNTSGINGETVFVFGFETDPAEVAALNNANVAFTGSFQATGAYGTAQDTQFEGTASITADFRDAGSVQVDLDGRFNNGNDITMGAASLPIGDGSFAGAIACTQGCTGNNSLIDGTFYGPDAAEVGGVLAIDISVGGIAYDGVGSFIIGRD